MYVGNILSGPNDARVVVWAMLGVFFGLCHVQTSENRRLHVTSDTNQEQPTKANAGQWWSTTASAGQCRPTKASTANNS
jgi:hypothetical protein